MGRIAAEVGPRELSEFRIRTAVEGDVSLILQFIRKLARYERLSDEMSATEELLRKNLFGERRMAEVILGEYQQTAVGFALYFYNFSTFLGRPGIYIEDIYVDDSHRGRGFGYAMFIHIVRLATERGCGRLEWSVLDWNTPAIRFYEKMGAVPLSDWTTYRLTGEPLERLAETAA